MKASALNNIGNVLQQDAGMNHDQIEHAAEKFRQALEYDPRHLDALYNLGNSFYTMSKYKDAISIFERVLEKHPTHPGANMNLGNIHLTAGNYEEALKRSQTILKSDQGGGSRATLRDRVCMCVYTMQAW